MADFCTAVSSDSILDQLMTINGGAGMTVWNVQQWYSFQAAQAKDNFEAMKADAKKFGIDTVLIEQLYRQQVVGIVKQKNEYLSQIANRGLDKLISGIEASITSLTTKLNGVEQERSEVLAELTKRANEARNAEKTLADARKSLAVSDLAPGGPLDQFKALQAQFADAIKAARGGDAGAATQAASLAQSLLQQGQQVYASGGAYSALFKSVNSQLASAQGAFGAGAQRIEKQLDPMTFTKVTEKSTAALLKAFATLNTTMERIEKQLAEQEKKLASAQQRSRVA